MLLPVAATTAVAVSLCRVSCAVCRVLCALCEQCGVRVRVRGRVRVLECIGWPCLRPCRQSHQKGLTQKPQNPSLSARAYRLHIHPYRRPRTLPHPGGRTGGQAKGRL